MIYTREKSVAKVITMQVSEDWGRHPHPPWTDSRFCSTLRRRCPPPNHASVFEPQRPRFRASPPQPDAAHTSVLLPTADGAPQAHGTCNQPNNAVQHVQSSNKKPLASCVLLCGWMYEAVCLRNLLYWEFLCMVSLIHAWLLFVILTVTAIAPVISWRKLNKN